MVGHFPVWHIFTVILCKSMCISAFVTFFVSFSFSCHVPYPFTLFLFVFFFFFLVAIFRSKIFRFLLNPVADMFSCHLLSVVDRIFFRCFGMSCFVCVISPFVDISLIFLLPPVLSGLFLQVVLLSFLVFPFPFYSYIFHRLSFVFSFGLFLPSFYLCFHIYQPLRSGKLWHKVSF